MILIVLSACENEKSSDVGAESGNSGSSGGANLAVGGSTSGSVAFAYSIAIGNVVGQETDINLQIQETFIVCDSCIINCSKSIF